MKLYKDLRTRFKKDIKRGACYCILCGNKIENYKDLSLEHLTPIARVNYKLAAKSYNIYPAIRIINTIKGSLLFCEWMNERVDLLQNSLENHKLTTHERILIEKALESTYTYNIDPCDFCIMYKYCQNCH